MSKNVALVIGHNSKAKGAFCKTLDMSENEFWRIVAANVLESGVEVDVYTRRYVQGRGYTSEMKEEVEMLNAGNYDFILELHFNANNNPKVRGCYCLVHPKSSEGKRIAGLFNRYTNELTGVPIRGDGLHLVMNTIENGGWPIYTTRAPYILVEPFFGSSEEDSELVNPLVFAKVIEEVINNA